MNTCVSKVETDEEREKRLLLEENKRKNRQIDKKIIRETKSNLSCLKLLLLGTGESGKSTIVKQMKIIHVNGFTNEEKIEFISNIKKNLRDAILAIVVSMNKLQIQSNNFDISEKVNYLQTSFNDDYTYPDEFFDVISELWQDPDVQLCYLRSNEYQLIDSAKYFLDRLQEIRQSDYIPSLQDILRCRKMTSGITEIKFLVREKKTKVNFKVLDVGGQQGERKRWIQLFDDVTAILFLADCSSFDQTLREDRSKNRLIDSLEVFYQAWINRYLQTVPIIVFLNKIDMLELKIKNGHSIQSMIVDISNLLPNQSNITTTSLLLNRRSSLNYSNHEKSNGKNRTYSKSNYKPNNLHPESNTVYTNYDRKSSIRTIPSYSSRRFSKDNNFECIAQIFQELPFEDYQPSNEDRKEFINSFPMDQLETSHSSVGKKRSKDTHNIHTDTIRTACYIKSIFTQIMKQPLKNYDCKNNRNRKCLFYYTCAVNTDNIQKVLDGCRSFLMEEHLERFGIL